MQSLPESVVQSAEDMRKALTSKAIEDENFRQMLVGDPKGAIRQEFGIDVPDYMNIVVHQSTTQEIHLALPATGGELNEEQLEAISAGLSCCG